MDWTEIIITVSSDDIDKAAAIAQVLVPGVVGPFIGKSVLANAETIIGNDGTESFVPNADIFLAALVVIVLVLPFILFLSRRRPNRINRLSTPYEIGEIPHNYHPRPSFKRDSFINLNGQWQFSVKKGENIEQLSAEKLLQFHTLSVSKGFRNRHERKQNTVYQRHETPQNSQVSPVA